MKIDRKLLRAFIRQELEKESTYPYVKELHLHITADAPAALELLRSIAVDNARLVEAILDRAETEGAFQLEGDERLG